jgi:hypothetical protein
VPVKPEDSTWYLNFSGVGETIEIELCYCVSGVQQAMCKSAPCRLPKLLPKCGGGSAKLRTPLVLLSGLDELEVLRSTTRDSRKPHIFGGK